MVHSLPVNLPAAPPLNAQPEQHIAQPLTLGLSIFDARNISNPRPLSEYTIREISVIQGVFNQTELSISGRFDEFSIALLFNLSQPDEVFNQMKPQLERIFREQLSPSLLHRHLNNMIILTLCLECREFISYFRWPLLNGERLIKNQLSLLGIDALMNAAKWSGGQEDPHFFKHLALFLELDGKHKTAESHGKKKSQASLLPNAIRNFLISDAMLSEETPTSLFEANAVYGSQVMKVTAGATMAFATAPVLGPFSALFLGVPFLISLASKAYFKSINAPPNVYPLFDSREIDLSHAENFLGRDEIIKEIFAAWQTNKHPLLVGDPGVGKTTIMELIIQRIAAGIIPGFESKVAFMGSAAQVMAPNPMGPPHLERLVKTIIPFKDNVILALDEFHALTADKTSSTYVRTMLDGSNGSIRYTLFATTTEDYEKSIQGDESLSRRLKVIDIKALSKNCLLHLLHREVKLASPLMDATAEAIEKIYQHANGNQNESRQLLYKIVRQIEANNINRPCYVKRQELKDEIQKNEGFARSQYHDVSKQNQYLDAISKASGELLLAEEDCVFFDLVYQKYQHLLQRCGIIVQEMSEISQVINKRLAEFTRKGTLTQKVTALNDPVFIAPIQDLFKQMLFQRYFNRPNHARFLKDYAKLFQLTHLIDHDRVDSLLDNP